MKAEKGSGVEYYAFCFRIIDSDPLFSLCSDPFRVLNRHQLFVCLWTAKHYSIWRVPAYGTITSDNTWA
jgi:hypothetical protein